MHRILEPELMNESEQAAAYAQANFSAAHNNIVQSFEHLYAAQITQGNILDLGCGCGDISFRLSQLFQQAMVIGVDGAAAMLQFAHKKRLDLPSAIQDRCKFLELCILSNELDKFQYQCIFSNSLLHHLHNPDDLWATINRLATSGTIIYICDLIRPQSTSQAKMLVDQYASSEPDVLQRDFYNSLLAAFSPEEIQQQLAENNLRLSIELISDRHMIIHGIF